MSVRAPLRAGGRGTSPRRLTAREARLLDVLVLLVALAGAVFPLTAGTGGATLPVLLALVSAAPLLLATQAWRLPWPLLVLVVALPVGAAIVALAHGDPVGMDRVGKYAYLGLLLAGLTAWAGTPARRAAIGLATLLPGLVEFTWSIERWMVDGSGPTRAVQGVIGWQNQFADLLVVPFAFGLGFLVLGVPGLRARAGFRIAGALALLGATAELGAGVLLSGSRFGLAMAAVAVALAVVAGVREGVRRPADPARAGLAARQAVVGLAVGEAAANGAAPGGAAVGEAAAGNAPAGEVPAGDTAVAGFAAGGAARAATRDGASGGSAWHAARGPLLAFAATALAYLLSMLLRGPLLFPGAGAATGSVRAVDRGFSLGDASFGYRLRLWRAALEMGADHPWTGVGLFRYPEYAACYDPVLDGATGPTWHPHNEWMYAWAVGGLALLLPMLLLAAGLVVLVVRSIRALLRGARIEEDPARWAGLVAVVLLAAAQLLEYDLYYPAILALLAASGAVATAGALRPRVGSPSRRRSIAWGSVLLAVLLGGVLAVLLDPNQGQLPWMDFTLVQRC